MNGMNACFDCWEPFSTDKQKITSICCWGTTCINSRYCMDCYTEYHHNYKDDQHGLNQHTSRIRVIAERAVDHAWERNRRGEL